MLYYLRRIGLLALLGGLLFLVGCRSVVPVRTFETDEPTSTPPLTQRLIIVVHGDASYLYHGPDGTAHAADVETIREAVAAAQSLSQAEVFIFHQRSHDPLLGIFPRDDGTLYHFRRGRLQRQTTYAQNRSDPLVEEASLVEAHRAPAPDSSLFTAALYYGHAVPERPRPGYHRSKKEAVFGIDGLAEGIDRLQPSGPFDVVVLSTCNGGTPPSVAAVAPHGRTLVAAPGDLHLSFIDADLLSTLSTRTPAVWAHQLAERAFDRLTERVTTAVTLATYALDRAAPAARQMVRQVAPDTSTAPTGARHIDCRQVLDTPIDTAGIRVWHRSARFGPQADREEHSGWGCTPKRKDGTGVNGDAEPVEPADEAEGKE